MAIRALTRQEFARFAHSQPRLAALSANAAEWFADDAGILVGLIPSHDSDHTWSFAVLGRDTVGQFHPLSFEFGEWRADEVRRLLLAKMETIRGATDQAFPAPVT